MAAQIISIKVGIPPTGVTAFRLQFSPNGDDPWTVYDPGGGGDISISNLDVSGHYLLDGKNSPIGNAAAASAAGNQFLLEWKSGAGYSNVSSVVQVAAVKTGPPLVNDVFQKLRYTAPRGLSVKITDDVQNLLDVVWAEFQGPPIQGGGGGRSRSGMSSGSEAVGGTGRNFTPITEIRFFDGSGWPQLRVDDIVPGSALVVKAYDATLIDVLLMQPVKSYVGHNVLIRPQGAGSILGASYATPGIFPLGLQNITVETTWGYSQFVPPDVWEAIRCEVAYRALVQGAIPLTGVGEDVRMGQFSINTSVGVLMWGKSSPVAIYHQQYLSAIERYKDRGSWRRMMYVRRMS